MMLSYCSRLLARGFCQEAGLEKIYDMIYQVKDITVIKSIHHNNPYFLIDKNKIELPKDQFVFSFNRAQESPNDYLEFLDRHMNVYNPSTPLAVICQESFFVRKGGYLYFIMNNMPLIERCQSKQFSNTYSSHIIEQICRESLLELPDDPKELVSGTMLHNLLLSNLLKHGMNFKVEKIRYKELLKIINRKINTFEIQIREMNQKIQRRASRRTRWFTSFLLAQYGLIHYMIYYHLSWDIMEPITCIIGNIDMFAAYFFFILRGQEWSLQEMHESYISRRKFANLRKKGVDIDKYEEALQIKQYLQFRLALLSKSPYQLYEQLNKPISLLNTH